MLYLICIFNDIFCINEHMKGDFSQNMRIKMNFYKNFSDKCLTYCMKQTIIHPSDMSYDWGGKEHEAW